jgi:hypothetical protein
VPAINDGINRSDNLTVSSAGTCPTFPTAGPCGRFV